MLYFAVPTSSSTGKGKGPSCHVDTRSPKTSRHRLNHDRQGSYYNYIIITKEMSIVNHEILP